MANYSEVVYCKDCDNCEITHPISHPTKTLYECKIWKYDKDGGYMMFPHDFCSRGKYRGVKEE